MPVFVSSRIYFDFQHDKTFEDSYEQLLRNIFDKPTHKRPALGVRPGYLNAEDPIFLPTAHRVRAIKTAFANERKNAPLLVKDYYQAFLQALRDFEPKENEFTPTNFVELALSRIDQMTPLRNDFISFMEVYCAATSAFDEEAMHDFFEQLAQYFADTNAAKADRNIGFAQYDYLRFFTYELLLYFVATLLRNGHFSTIAAFLHDSFIVLQEYREAEVETYMIFDAYNLTLNEEYNKKFQTNRSKVAGDKVKERVQDGYSFDELQQADVLLHFVSVLNYVTPGGNTNRGFWQPDTTVYSACKRPFFEKLVSQRYFEKVKTVFGVSTKEELAAKVTLLKTDPQMQSLYNRLRWHHDGLPDIIRVLDAEKIATVN